MDDEAELNRMRSQIAEAKQRAEAASAEALRNQVAWENGVAAEHIDLLGTGTRDDMQRRAERVNAMATNASSVRPATPVPGKPRPSLTAAVPVEQDDLELWESVRHHFGFTG